MSKKVRNATPVTHDGINFKSNLEGYCYLYFKKRKINLKYEECVLPVIGGFTSNLKAYIPERKSKNRKSPLLLREMRSKILPITYTPDFTYRYKNKLFIIECKGKPNDVYPYKRKLFFRYLTQIQKNKGGDFYFFEPHNQKQIEQTFEIITKIINNESI